MIKQADENDIKVIEKILLDAVKWMENSKLQNQWTENSIKWDILSREYQIHNFYIHYQNDIPAGCIAITDLDQKYWPEIPKGKSLFIHKLAVKREFAGKGITSELIKYAKNVSLIQEINSLRLDCDFHKGNLRRLYESEGFEYLGKKKSGIYDIALYKWTINKMVS